MALHYEVKTSPLYLMGRHFETMQIPYLSLLMLASIDNCCLKTPFSDIYISIISSTFVNLN